MMKLVIRVHLAMMTSFLWMAALNLASTEQNTFIDHTVTRSSQPDSQLRSADYITLRNEQIASPSKYWDMAQDIRKMVSLFKADYSTVMVKLLVKK